MTDSSTIQKNNVEKGVKKRKHGDDDENINWEQEYKKLRTKCNDLEKRCEDLSKMRSKKIFTVSDRNKKNKREKGSTAYYRIEKIMIDATLDLRHFAMCHYGFFPNTVVPKLDKIAEYWHQIFDKRIIKTDENREKLITEIEQKQLWLLCLFLIASLTKRKLGYQRTDKKYYDILVPLCVKFEKLFKDQQDNDFGCFQTEMIETYIGDVFGKCLLNYFDIQILDLLQDFKFDF